MEWRERDGVRWLEAALDGAAAAFTARQGGVSGPPFESLNVGILTGDRRDDVIENRGRLAGALGRDPAGILIGLQVHETEIARHDEALSPSPWLAEDAPPPADGQVTENSRLTPLVQVADCLPVALAGGGRVAMLHCGWRGLAAGIVARGVERTEAREAAIGPGIGACCYEVGDEVLARFEPLGDGIAAGRMLDLAEVARRLLAEAGVSRVQTAGLCTSCERELFFSHRRDGGTTGRQAGLAWIEAGSP